MGHNQLHNVIAAEVNIFMNTWGNITIWCCMLQVAQDLHLETDQKGFKVEGTTVLKPMDPIRLKLTKI